MKVKKLFFILLFVLGIIIVSFTLLPANWDTKARFILAFPGQKVGASICIFDPKDTSIICTQIPAEAQTVAAGTLGQWKMGSIWELGYQQKLGGQFFAQTILKSFNIPVDGWADEHYFLLTDKNIWNVLKVLFSKRDSSLTFKDKVNLVIFSVNVGSSEKYFVEMESEIPSKMLPKIVDPSFFDTRPKIQIVDATSSPVVARQVRDIAETLGGKVLSIKEIERRQSDCEIHAKDQKIIKRIAKLLGCSVSREAPEGNFDIQITLGDGFVKRF